VSQTALLFDFGGTLDADGERWAVRFHREYAAAGGRLALDQFEPIFRQSDRQLEMDPAIGTMGFRAMIDAQADLLLRLLPDGGALDQGRIAAGFHAEALAIVNRNRGVLEALTHRYRLGMVSNFTGNLACCLAELELAAMFAEVSDSAVVGWAKPDPRIFELALDALGARASDAWMIGDNPESDIRAAAALGLRTCWLASPERTPPDGVAPTARIARLTELPEVIARCTD